MKIHVLQKQIEYQGCPIVIRRIGSYFEYVTCINNQIYSSYIVARKSVLQFLLGNTYTTKQTRDITNYMIAMAQTTIDSVLGTVKK